MSKRAEIEKETGNEAYKSGQYEAAISHYTEALNLCPDIAAYYSNRAASYFMLKMYKNSLCDSLSALAVDHRFLKAHFRAAKCYIALGKFSKAMFHLEELADSEAFGEEINKEIEVIKCVRNGLVKVRQAVEIEDHQKVLALTETFLSVCPYHFELKLHRAESLIKSRAILYGASIVDELLESEENTADVLYLKAKVLYCQGKSVDCMFYLSKALDYDRTHFKSHSLIKTLKLFESIKRKGVEHFELKKYADAIESFTQAIEMSSENVIFQSSLFLKKAHCLALINKHEEAISMYFEALRNDSNNAEIYASRAQSYIKMEKYELAVKDFERATEINKTDPYLREQLRQVRKFIRQLNERNHYTILGVTPHCSDIEIKKAFRKMALTHHPDKVQGNDQDKNAAEKTFREINEAYSVLSDSLKRREYDRLNLSSSGFSVNKQWEEPPNYFNEENENPFDQNDNYDHDNYNRDNYDPAEFDHPEYSYSNFEEYESGSYGDAQYNERQRTRHYYPGYS